ncbi:hypothetical protein JF66_19005 [Cryobacterium sp. MLB-32]|uniref:prepilin-type N-terminal cleavage/methylation domain-containing protein n=1 Tax=Cryobacterium sp. MLB-32 TaxID=1529318 RepID=UPI0004E61B41|nr:prepilin-type N-terminal cleavage/methylation domain-containing protein [Cryobacterium sp. MLB-32]KFF58380.1 hypothetical protein JF66_19005 [Cryobacterium sp. MLB-32]
MTLPRSEPDQGFTLVELIVYSALLLVVLALVGGFFMTGLTASSRVEAVTKASNAGQTVADSIEMNIRNSTDFHLSVPVGTDQFLVARTAKRGATLSWGCVAWYYSVAGGSIYFTQSDTAILRPTTADLLNWVLVDNSVAPLSGSGIFTATGQQLTVNFKSLADDHPPIRISSSATSRAGASGNLTCF